MDDKKSMKIRNVIFVGSSLVGSVVLH